MMLSLLLGFITAEANEDYTIAVSPEVSPASLDVKTARRLFTWQTRRWDSGQPVQIILPPLDSEGMEWLSQQVLGLEADLYHRYLLEKAYRSGEDPPPFLTQPAPPPGTGQITVLPTTHETPLRSLPLD